MGRDIPGLWKGELNVGGVGIEIERGQSQLCNHLSLQWDTLITGQVRQHYLTRSRYLTPSPSSVCVTFHS